MADFLIVIFPLILILILIIYMMKNFNVVKANEIHIISGKGFKVFDGEGRYIYQPMFQTRNIINKELFVFNYNFPRRITHFDFDLQLSIITHFGDPKAVIEKYKGEKIGKEHMSGVVDLISKEGFMRVIDNYETISIKQLLAISDQINMEIKSKLGEMGILLKEINLEIIDSID